MSIALDIIVLSIILITALLAAKRGFVRTFIESAGFVAAVLVAIHLGTMVSTFIYDKAIGPKIVDSAANTAVTTAQEMVDSVWDSLPDFIDKTASLVGINKDTLSQNVVTFDTGDAATTIQKALDATVKPVFVKVVGMVCTVLLFIALTFLVRILAKLLNKLFSFGVTGNLNKTLGGIIGLIKGLLFALVFCIAVSLITAISGGFLIFSNEAIEGSYIFKHLLSLTPFSF